jgi:hypothetical protein
MSFERIGLKGLNMRIPALQLEAARQIILKCPLPSSGYCKNLAVSEVVLQISGEKRSVVMLQYS